MKYWILMTAGAGAGMAVCTFLPPTPRLDVVIAGAFIIFGGMCIGYILADCNREEIE